jgi:hypothetical protein
LIPNYIPRHAAITAQVKIEDSPVDSKFAPAKIDGVGDGRVPRMVNSGLNENGLSPNCVQQSMNAAFSAAVYLIKRPG